MSSRSEEVEAWYKANAENIKKWGSKRSVQDAEDILQDTAVKLLVNPAKWEIIIRKDVTRRIAWTYYNRGYAANMTSNVPIEVIEDQVSDIDLEAQTYTKEQQQILNFIIDELDGKCKIIFTEKIYREKTYAEIAEYLSYAEKYIQKLGIETERYVKERYKEIMNKGMQKQTPIFSPEMTLNEIIEIAEKNAIVDSIAFYGSKIMAAKKLNVNRSVFFKKLKKYELTGDQNPGRAGK